jgi:hypothetical protein
MGSRLLPKRVRRDRRELERRRGGGGSPCPHVVGSDELAISKILNAGAVKVARLVFTASILIQ